MRMPYDLPQEAIEFGYVPGGVYKMLKAVYGRIDSPNIFATQLTVRLIDEKWQNVAEAIYVKSTEAKGLHQGVLRTHMDDLFCNGEDAVALLSDIKKHFQTGPITEFKEGEFGVYNGIRIRWDSKSGVAEHDQKDYADGIDTKLTKAESRRRFGAKDLELTKDDEINVDYKPEQQSWTGVLGWMARTQPHLSVIFSMISRNNTRPSAQSVLSVKRACQYAKDNHVSLKFHGVENPVLILWLDGSFSLTECDGRKGWEAQVVDESEVDEKDWGALTESNVIGWRSTRLARKVSSSSAAELEALVDVVKRMPLYENHIECLWGKKPKVFILTDSDPVISWLNVKWIKSDPKLQGLLNFVLDRLNESDRVRVLYVSTKINRADKHTKFIHV